MERKVKYGYAFKLECVKLVLENNFSALAVSKLKGPDESNIRKWVGFFKRNGENGLVPRKNSSYSVEFKLKVLASVDRDLLTLRDASLQYDIPDVGIIVKWKRDFANFGIEGLQSKPRGRPKPMNNNKRKKRKSDRPLTREEELLSENEALRCENDLLKKLHALIRAEEKAKKRKP